jgi:hypothetical protein
MKPSNKPLTKLIFDSILHCFVNNTGLRRIMMGVKLFETSDKKVDNSEERFVQEFLQWLEEVNLEKELESLPVVFYE